MTGFPVEWQIGSDVLIWVLDVGPFLEGMVRNADLSCWIHYW